MKRIFIKSFLSRTTNYLCCVSDNSADLAALAAGFTLRAVMMQPHEIKAIIAARMIQSTTSTAMPSSAASPLRGFNHVSARKLRDLVSQPFYAA